MKKGFVLLLLVAFLLALSACDATVSEMNVGGSAVSGKEQSASGKPSWGEMLGQVEQQPQWDETVPMESDEVIVIRPTEEERQPMTTLDYWIEYCDVLYLSSTDLYGLTQEEARIARNAIYAKSGRMFKDEGLTAYFNTYSWYYPRYSSEYFSDDMLSDVQQHNLELVIDYEGRWK